uniref:Uncharacterized protein n=1 Tax=Lygus hesperus TaxID=30085 RepID=A0A146LPY8_LYGHE
MQQYSCHLGKEDAYSQQSVMMVLTATSSNVVDHSNTSTLSSQQRPSDQGVILHANTIQEDLQKIDGIDDTSYNNSIIPASQQAPTLIVRPTATQESSKCDTVLPAVTSLAQHSSLS